MTRLGDVRRRHRRLATAAIAVVVAAAMMVGVLWSIQRRLIYFPDRATPPPAEAVLPGSRDVVLRTSDGLRLAAWLVPPPQRAARQVAVLVAPGNAGNRRDRVMLAGALARAGLTVLVLDYRGYGGNPGSPSEDGLARDADAGWAHLTDAERFPPGRIILFGESLGAAVVTALAGRLTAAGHPPGGLALRSPFLSLTAVGRTHYPYLPVGTLLRDRYPVADLISQVPVPTTVVYGTADRVVPPAQSREVAARAADPVAVVAVPGADHNDAALAAGPAIVDAVVGLADRSAN